MAAKRKPRNLRPKKRTVALKGGKLRMKGHSLESDNPRVRTKLWTPWRMAYIKGHLTTGPKLDKDRCILCQLLEMKDGDGNLILERSEHAYVVMNRYPYTNGHVMIVPKRHTSDFPSLTAAESDDLMRLMRRSVASIQKAIRAQGFNIGMNVGRVAGAGIDEHLHFHVVPRWNGDTNFMPVLADVNLVNDHLIDCYRLLRRTLGETRDG